MSYLICVGLSSYSSCLNFAEYFSQCQSYRFDFEIMHELINIMHTFNAVQVTLDKIWRYATVQPIEQWDKYLNNNANDVFSSRVQSFAVVIVTYMVPEMKAFPLCHRIFHWRNRGHVFFFLVSLIAVNCSSIAVHQHATWLIMEERSGNISLQIALSAIKVLSVNVSLMITCSIAFCWETRMWRSVVLACKHLYTEHLYASLFEVVLKCLLL